MRGCGSGFFCSFCDVHKLLVVKESPEEKYRKVNLEKSNGTIEVLAYTGAKERAVVKCFVCNHEGIIEQII